MVSLRGPFRLACWGALALLILLAWAGCTGGDHSVSVTLTATPAIISSGEETLLQWTSHNATRVDSSNFGAAAVSGSQAISPTDTTTYTITVGNDDSATTATASATVHILSMPPQPQSGATPDDPFYVRTDNYFYEYTSSTAPFPSAWQLSDGLYPPSLSYQSVATPPDGFVLRDQGELGIILLAQADPRVAVISGVDPPDARIQVQLVESITYNNLKNIIGLTKVFASAGVPRYEVYVVTIDPATGGPMPFYEIQRTLTHELGHVFGLGHSPDTHDLMYYQSNGQQGNTPARFLTFGDAIALWTTLTQQLINWHPDRPPITPAGVGTLVLDARNAHVRVTDEDGLVICVYPK